MALKNKFKTTSLPAFLFLDSNETVLYALKGEMKTPEFLAEANYALNPNFQLPYLEKSFWLIRVIQPSFLLISIR